MKPIDPQLLRRAPAARQFVAGAAFIALAQTMVTIAFAGLVAYAIALVAEAIAGTPDAAGGDDRVASGVLATLGTIALVLVGVVLARSLLVLVSEAWGLRAAARTGSQLRATLLAAIERRGPGWLAHRNQTALAVTAGHGLDALDPYFSRYIPQLVLTAIATPVIVAVMWWYDWPSGLAAALTLPLIPIFLVLIGLATRSVHKRQLGVLQRLAAQFADTLQGLATLRIFRREDRAVHRVRETAEEYRKETMRVLRYSFLSGFALELLSSLAVAIIAVAVGLRLLAGNLDLGTGLFVLLLAPEAFLPLRQVGVQFHAAEEGVTAVDEVLSIIADAEKVHPDRATDVPGNAAADRETTGLNVRALCITHDDRSLPSVSFLAQPGTITLIEGPSGTGKSSVFAALRHAVDYTGTATWNGIDVRCLHPAEWLAWAGQQPALFRGTIASNVALGAEPDTHAVRRALDDAGASELAPDRELGERGAGVSGGQAQRIAVARALYRLRAPGRRLLALDEPSSALDETTETHLWNNLRRIADEGTTVVVISHRASARRIADTVITMHVADSEEPVRR
ncbi:thiol reductant ABC exporter subunit CydD [Microbacterium sp. YY-01]|uniref:thiol reductant ABC exporter subunit CydD n=1 Tax=Microbacterium sp. YY-01 TaxID=3421634 RepID=UPI003D180705